ncbi:MAG: hypothetical protein Q8R12_00980 [bacterium]|nr:hypothetical protein [bacterium]
MGPWNPTGKAISIIRAEIRKIRKAKIKKVASGEEICGHFNRTGEETIFILTGEALLETVDFSSDDHDNVHRDEKLSAPCRITIPHLVAHQLTFLSPSSYLISFNGPADPDEVFRLRL